MYVALSGRFPALPVGTAPLGSSPWDGLIPLYRVRFGGAGMVYHRAPTASGEGARHGRQGHWRRQPVGTAEATPRGGGVPDTWCVLGTAPALRRASLRFTTSVPPT